MDLAWLASLIVSYSYNRTRYNVIEMLKCTKARVLNEGYNSCNYNNDDVNILFGAICLKYGDYGTSPRTGWIDEDNKPQLLKFLDEQILYYVQLPEE